LPQFYLAAVKFLVAAGSFITIMLQKPPYQKTCIRLLLVAHYRRDKADRIYCHPRATGSKTMQSPPLMT
jgi:hypothetical protein